MSAYRLAMQKNGDDVHKAFEWLRQQRENLPRSYRAIGLDHLRRKVNKLEGKVPQPRPIPEFSPAEMREAIHSHWTTRRGIDARNPGDFDGFVGRVLVHAAREANYDKVGMHDVIINDQVLKHLNPGARRAALRHLRDQKRRGGVDHKWDERALRRRIEQMWAMRRKEAELAAGAAGGPTHTAPSSSRSPSIASPPQMSATSSSPRTLILSSFPSPKLIPSSPSPTSHPSRPGSATTSSGALDWLHVHSLASPPQLSPAWSPPRTSTHSPSAQTSTHAPPSHTPESSAPRRGTTSPGGSDWLQTHFLASPPPFFPTASPHHATLDPPFPSHPSFPSSSPHVPHPSSPPQPAATTTSSAGGRPRSPRVPAFWKHGTTHEEQQGLQDLYDAFFPPSPPHPHPHPPS